MLKTKILKTEIMLKTTIITINNNTHRHRRNQVAYKKSPFFATKIRQTELANITNNRVRH